MILNVLKIFAAQVPIHVDNHVVSAAVFFKSHAVSHLEMTEFAVHVHQAHKVDSREKK